MSQNHIFAGTLTDFWGQGKTNFRYSETVSKFTESKSLQAFKLDYKCKQAGDFSIRFNADSAQNANYIGTIVDRYRKSWKVDEDYQLHFRIRFSSKPKSVVFFVITKKDQILKKDLQQFQEDKWYELEIPLKKFAVEGKSEPNIDEIQACGIYSENLASKLIWFDDIYFKNENDIVGVTENTISNRMSLAEKSRKRRAKLEFKNWEINDHEKGLKRYLVKLYQGQDINEVNTELYNLLTTEDEKLRFETGLTDHWGLGTNQILYRLYFMFGSKGRVAPGRLSKKTESALLEELWNRTKLKNDIYLAQKSTWWLVGSENHDMVANVSNLLSSQIFMNEQKFSDKIYPDPGKGSGKGYWFYHMYGGAADSGPSGRANWKEEGQEYNASDHYAAWVDFMKQYLRQRIKKGFFLEVASPGYMRVTLSHLYDLYDYCNDDELQNLVGKFLDVAWTKWSQDAISGIRGGAKTRADYFRFNDAMRRFACFEFGGMIGGLGGNFWIPLITNYRLPKYVWKFALDRDYMGSYEYISRKPGEEQDIRPRPKGLERSMLCDTESRLLRYSWVTPDYIMGCQMDHPSAVHCHLSVASRWQGITFAGDDGCRVFPAEIEVGTDNKWSVGKHAYFRSLQDSNVMICQQNRRWTQANPIWYPAIKKHRIPVGVYFSKNLDKIEEEKNWIFVEENNAYLAVRKVKGEIDEDYRSWSSREEILENSYNWNKEQTMIRCDRKFNTFIFEAGRKKDYATMEKFKKSIFNNEIKLKRTVVPGWYIVIYKTGANNQKVYTFNAANNEIPKVNGEYFNYAPDVVFKSPYLNSDYNNGTVNINTGNKEISLEFE